jgi:hypothetical protein
MYFALFSEKVKAQIDLRRINKEFEEELAEIDNEHGKVSRTGSETRLQFKEVFDNYPLSGKDAMIKESQNRGWCKTTHHVSLSPPFRSLSLSVYV